MRKAGVFFLVFGVFALSAVSAAAQDRNSITGFVFDESRRPVSRIYVELQNDVYVSVARTLTQGSGIYTFAGLPSGQYYVKVLNTGTDFEEQSRFVSLIPVSRVGRGSVQEQVDFYLKARKRGTGPTGSPGSIFVQEVPAAARSLYDDGLSDLGNNNETAGMDKIKRSIELFPEYYDALDRLGNEYISRGHYEPAYVLLAKALTVNPRSFSSTLGIGLAEFRLGQNDRALDRFKQAVSLDKRSVNAHLWLGITLHGKGDLAPALKALLEANKLSGGEVPEVHWQLARVYKDQKKYPEAANELELFLKYRPDAQNAEGIKQVIASLRLKK